MKQYIVVENAGYERETDVAEFTRYADACAFIAKTYAPDEIESLHVMVATEIDGEREY